MDDLRLAHHRLALLVGEGLGLRHFHPGRQALVHLPQGLVSQKLRAVGKEQHIGAHMLDGLEGADGTAEGHPVLGVIYRHLSVFAGCAYHLATEKSSGALQHPLDDRPAVMQFAHQVGAGYFHAVEGDPALLVLGDGNQRRLRYAGPVGVDQEQ